jgi:transposase
MHDPYVAVIRAHCPTAALICDHFHVLKPMGLAIDKVRRRLQSELPPAGRVFLRNSRYLLLRPKETLSGNRNVRLRELLAVNETLNMAYVLKEDLRVVFRLNDPLRARAKLKDWKRRARESGIPELQAYVKTLNRRRFGIMNFFKHRKTNGLSKGFINVVKTLKKDAYGFHDWPYFRLKILRQCGKLREVRFEKV